ncbi:MAG: DUF1549 domain-containing protein [Phycisphaeraceae bacterium]
MNRLRAITCALAACILIAAPLSVARAVEKDAAANPADIEFFEKHIRPLFAQHCAECHDGKKKKGGLRLDSPAFIAKGGDTGKIFIAGKPDASMIIKAVRHGDPDFKMPPKKKLSDEEIALLVKWIERGAALPQDKAPTAQGPYDYDKWRQFWSFKPLEKPAVPLVKNEKWVRNPIDAFIAAKHEALSLAPAPQADRYTLIRRATFDLLGLPPTPAEIERFINDTAPDAYEKLIHRLLASPYYGEKYGRHWLDVARYEQGRVKVPGVKNTRGELNYRDYVVRAFNMDKPYNRFIVEQLAGDLLPASLEKQDYFDQLIATAYLSIGNWFDECTDPNRLRLDMIDEQINATSKAFLGLTVSCARCHDHKHDPITTEDYYALAGIFRSTRIVEEFNEEWRDGRVRLTREMVMPEETEKVYVLQGFIALTRFRLWTLLEAEREALVNEWKKDEAAYRTAASKIPPRQAWSFEAEQFAGQSDLKITELKGNGEDVAVLEAQKPVDQWVKYELRAPSAGTYVLEALYWTDTPRPLDVQVGGTTVLKETLAQGTLHADFKARRWGVLGAIELREGVNTIRLSPSEKGGRFPTIDRLRWYAVDPARQAKVIEVARPSSLNADRLARYADHPDAPWPTHWEVLAFRDEHQKKEVRIHSDRLAQAEADLQKLDMQRIIAATDYREPTALPVHISGDTYRTRGEPEPRGVPVLFEHALKPPTIPPDRSGRLELAQWIASPKHPLTARVMANRLWQWHFGNGLVETPNDFGSHGSPPTHPDLLDWLAATFIEKGWSMKEMHFIIMTSATYRMEGQGPRAKGQGAESTQYSVLSTQYASFPRRRLSVEEIYDAMLVTIGKLPRLTNEFDFNKSADRMMYVLTSNRSPVGLGQEIRKMFAVFDYDPTGEPIGQRGTSATAAQALFWLNNPIPQHFAKVFAEQLLLLNVNDEARLDRAFLAATGRPAEREMKQMLLDFLREAKEAKMSETEVWTQVCLAIYRSNAFRYVD